MLRGNHATLKCNAPIDYGLLALQRMENMIDFLAQIVYNRISNGAVMISTAPFLFQEVIL